MGPAFSFKNNKQQHDAMTISKLNKRYHSKVYAQNRKSFEKFMKQIEAVCKKASYLSYKWAKCMHAKLQSTKVDQLYSEYQIIFLENCRRDGQHELVFQAIHMQKIFLNEIIQKYDTKRSILSLAQLKSLIFQCKCYFMVMNWLHKISSFSETKMSDLEDCQRQIFSKFMQEDIVYCQILETASKTYVGHLQKQEISRILIGEYEFDPKIANREIFKQLKKLRKCDSFHEKQKIIAAIQKNLLENDENLDEHLDLIQRLFGKSKIFAHLLIIKQLGSQDVSYLWQKIYQGKYDHLIA